MTGWEFGLSSAVFQAVGSTVTAESWQVEHEKEGPQIE